ncbi:MAG TPA: hypothetical protein VIG06_24755 [Kofleriaceae bacterium]
MRIAGAVLSSVFLCAAAAVARAEPGPYGVMGDVGLPDGMVASFAYRAHPHIDVHAGIGHNTNSFGGRVGGAWLPIRAIVSPFAALEVGGFLQADTADWMQSTAKSAGLDDKTLERVGYWYSNAHVGARVGSGNAAFYLQGGLTFIDATTHIIKPKPDYVPPVDLYRETEVRVLAIGGRAGLVYWF